MVSAPRSSDLASDLYSYILSFLRFKAVYLYSIDCSIIFSSVPVCNLYKFVQMFVETFIYENVRLLFIFNLYRQ